MNLLDIQLNTWLGFTYSFLILFFLRLILKSILKLRSKKYIKNSVLIKLFSFRKDYLLMLFDFIAVLILLLEFISINYLLHTIFLVFVLGVFYGTIKTILIGFVFRLNPFAKKGVYLESELFRGKILNFLTTGIVLQDGDNRRMVSYKLLHGTNYAFKFDKNHHSRQVIFVSSDFSKDEIINVLFQCPFIDNNIPVEVFKTGEREWSLNCVVKSNMQDDFKNFLTSNNLINVIK